jgi:hypothetical protein
VRWTIRPPRSSPPLTKLNTLSLSLCLVIKTEACHNEAKRLIRISEEIRVSIEKIVAPTEKSATNGEKGFCIRCQKEIPFNASAPYCGECYKVWKKYENPTYQEKYCHMCGKENTSSFNKPICYDCYKQNKDKLATKG